MRRLYLVFGAVLALGALLFGGAWIYANVVADDAPDRLGLSSTSPTPTPTSSGGTADSGSVVGRWTVTTGSQVGYRVDEVLFGQEVTAVGRTREVSGSLVVADAAVTEAEFTVDMASIRSDQDRRDNQYRTRIMSTDQYPTSTFKLTKPISVGTALADGQTVEAEATGELTLRGVTKTVTFEVQARRTGGTVAVAGSIPVVFAEWNIPEPSFGPARVESSGEMEFSLVLGRA